MAAEDDFVHGGCHGSDTSQRINDQKKQDQKKGKRKQLEKEKG